MAALHGSFQKKGATPQINERALVLEAFLLADGQNGYEGTLLKGVLDKYDYLDGHRKAFIKRLFEGCVEYRIRLDYILNCFSKTKTEKMKPVILHILRMGVYQLLYMDSIPDSAVCNEAVKLTAKKGFAPLKGFINGVLRNIARNKENLPMPDDKKDPIGACSVRYAMPKWLVRFFCECYGEEKTHTVLEAMMQSAPVTIRMDERLGVAEKEKALEQMRQSGIRVCPHPALSYAYTLHGAQQGIRSVPGYEEGLFYVQDVSSMLVSEIAGIREGMHILDVCAAPGGKSLHAAVKLRGTGMVTACDVTERKTALIEENRRRCRIENMTVQQRDALIFVPEDARRYDIVYADLPCSGLGIMGKKCDIRHRMSLAQMNELALLQRRMLDTVTEYVKDDGVLIYSTCTMNPEENERQLDYLLEKGFVPEAIDRYLPPQFACDGARKGYIQMFPGIHGTDGFFIARLKRMR